MTTTEPFHPRGRRRGSRGALLVGAVALAALLATAPLTATPQSEASAADPPSSETPPVDRPQAEGPGSGAFAERLEVTLVTVDVWVTDRQGEPVTDLPATAFEVLQDGRPVPISHFVEVRDGRAFAPAATPEALAATAEVAPATTDPADTSSENHHLILFFDSTRLHPQNLGPVLGGLEELLASGGLDPGRVLILRHTRGLTVEAPFGSTAEELRSALDRLARGDASGMSLENEDQLAVEAVQQAWERSQDSIGAGVGGVALAPGGAGNAAGGGGGGGGGQAGSLAAATGFGGGGALGGPDACGSFVNQAQPILSSWARSRAARLEASLAGLTDAVSFLSGLPGVKSLVYLSDGLDLRPGQALSTYAAGLCPSAGSDFASSVRLQDHTGRLRELTRHANSNRVTVHAIEATGLRSPGGGSAAASSGPRGGGALRSSGVFEATQRSGDREGMEFLADQTGGQAVVNRNEFTGDFARIAAATRHHYSLAYEPPRGDPADDIRTHAIEVRVAGDALVTRYRRGFTEKSAEQRLAERLEGALNLGITDNPLGVRLGAGTVEPGAEDALRITLHVMVPVERLTFLPAADGTIAEVALKVMARSFDHDVVALRERVFRVRGAPGATGFADLPIVLDLKPGRHLTAVAVFDVSSRQASYVATALDLEP